MTVTIIKLIWYCAAVSVLAGPVPRPSAEPDSSPVTTVAAGDPVVRRNSQRNSQKDVSHASEEVMREFDAEQGLYDMGSTSSEASSTESIENAAAVSPAKRRKFRDAEQEENPSPRKKHDTKPTPSGMVRPSSDLAARQERVAYAGRYGGASDRMSFDTMREIVAAQKVGLHGGEVDKRILAEAQSRFDDADAAVIDADTSERHRKVVEEQIKTGFFIADLRMAQRLQNEEAKKNEEEVDDQINAGFVDADLKMAERLQIEADDEELAKKLQAGEIDQEDPHEDLARKIQNGEIEPGQFEIDQPDPDQELRKN